MFACSIGDEVASNAEQLKAKNDRHNLVLKCRKLQSDLDAMSAKKDAAIDTLTKELRDHSELKSKEILDLTSSHAVLMTQLQSTLMSDVDIYYTKSKCLEEEVERKQCSIQELTEKIYQLESEIHDLRNSVKDRENVLDSSVTDTEGSTFTNCSESITSPSIDRLCHNSSKSLTNSPKSPGSTCDGLTLSTVQLWNENLRQELQRVHIDLEQERTQVGSLTAALAQSETQREQIESLNEELQDQVKALVSCKEDVMAVVETVRRENADLKQQLRRIKYL